MFSPLAKTRNLLRWLLVVTGPIEKQGMAKDERKVVKKGLIGGFEFQQNQHIGNNRQRPILSIEPY